MQPDDIDKILEKNKMKKCTFIFTLLSVSTSIFAMQRFSCLAKTGVFTAMSTTNYTQLSHLQSRFQSTNSSTDMRDFERALRIKWLQENREKDSKQLKKLIEQRKKLVIESKGKIAGSFYRASLVGDPLTVFIYEAQPEMKAGVIVFMATGIRLLKALKEDDTYPFDCAAMNREFKFLDSNICRLRSKISVATSHIETAIELDKKEKSEKEVIK